MSMVRYQRDTKFQGVTTTLSLLSKAEYNNSVTVSAYGNITFLIEDEIFSKNTVFVILQNFLYKHSSTSDDIQNIKMNAPNDK